jgi:Uma2 family endonuclease
MATVLQREAADHDRGKIGPGDHGRPMTLEEFMTGDYIEGYQYELIDGKLYVSPQPNLPENLIELWLLFKLKRYAEEHPDVINHVTTKARVFVPGRRGITNPELDVAAYRDFPLHGPFRGRRWQDFSPVLVAEILTGEDPEKDLVRNVQLYRQVPSIQEYWLFDGREDPDQPTLRAYRRSGKRWRPREVAAGETSTTRLLPGFALTVDPHR